ncbi:MAG TPA: hypothetical protein VHN55_01125 [Sphingomicrobium sp.]|nr:hypothetical protein [Sphingomicrobium sp.]
MSDLQQIAATAPLRLEPFLVAAALAQRAGDYDRAEVLLRQARVRDPRSPAALYLLADVSLRKGKTVEGLHNMAILSRILPETSVQLTPALAEYAQTPGARQELAGILAENRQLKRPLLIALAADPDNADLILDLAGPAGRTAGSDSKVWQSRLLEGLVARGDYERAHSLWRQFAGVGEGPRPLLFNGEFKRLDAPPPFNWSFSSADAGFSEPGNNGRLRILYYGRDDSVLASQLLLLPPGTYRFRAPVSGRVAAGTLAFALRCRGTGNTLVNVPIREPAAEANFTVPSGRCGAQLIQLRGHAQEMPEDSDVRVGPARIERVGG